MSMQLIVKNFFLAGILFWRVILGVDKYIFPWQTWFSGGEGHLRLESSCIQVNMESYKLVDNLEGLLAYCREHMHKNFFTTQQSPNIQLSQHVYVYIIAGQSTRDSLTESECCNNNPVNQDIIL
jgi:hypothetical protein